MNAASKPAGLQVGSTRPLSRPYRRAPSPRVTPPETPPAAPGPPNTHIPPAPPDGEQEARQAEPVRLKARLRKVKSPFATQLHAGTLARLEWIKARGYVITDTVDEAINRYLDNAGIPKPDRNDRMP